MMMKTTFKIWSLIALVALLLGACAPAATPTAAPAAAQPAPAKQELLIAYSQAELVNAWRVTNQKDMENQAKQLGAKLISVDANQDPSKQLADVENMLAQKPACLIVSPLESKASAPVVKLADEAKVPLVIIDRTIDATPGTDMYKTEITQSHVLSGKLLAEKTVELLTKKYGGAKGSVVHVQGLAGASPVIDANKGWDEVMAKYPNIKVVATSDAGFTKDGGIITINGGSVSATGGNYGAGIGGGYSGERGNTGSGGTITIKGGAVTVLGGNGGAGIGGGYKGNGGTITVKGGMIRSTGGDAGAGTPSLRSASATAPHLTPSERVNCPPSEDSRP
jgi:hypothetical protein